MKKWLKIFGLTIISLVVLSIIFSAFVGWIKNGGDAAGLLETSRNLKNGSSFIQAGLLVFLFLQWEQIIVSRSATKAHLALRKAKYPVCSVAFGLLILFWSL